MIRVAMILLLLAGWGVFAWSAWRRWKLLRVGQPAARFDQVGERLRGVWRFAFKQERMPRYWWSGIAHQIIFVGFIVLLLRTLILWGRGLAGAPLADRPFGLWLFDVNQPLGVVYSIVKDVFVVLVLAAALVFVYFRAIR